MAQDLRIKVCVHRFAVKACIQLVRHVERPLARLCLVYLACWLAAGISYCFVDVKPHVPTGVTLNPKP